MQTASQNPMSIWGIVGLGWLGQALSESLRQSGCVVWGTHRETFVFGKDIFPSDYCDVLLLNVPPLLDIDPERFVSEISLAPTARLIFVSSTSVYGTHQGACSEEVTPEPTTDNGKWLLNVEELLRQQFAERSLVIRPGGLLGGQRHPGFHLKADRIYAGGENPINFIHREDLINIIKLSAQNHLSGVLNAVTPYHPSKESYYTQWLNQRGLAVPSFEMCYTTHKVVSSKILPTFYTSWVCPHLDSL